MFSVILSLTSRVILSSASGAETFKPSADTKEEKHQRETEKNTLIISNFRKISGKTGENCVAGKDEHYM